MPNLWDVVNLKPGTEVPVRGETLPALFWNAVAQRADAVWLREKEFGIWRSWTWRQVGDAVREIACGLVALGFTPGERASILAGTVVEWVLADLALLSAGGVASGIYPTDSASQVGYLCDDSESVVLFVEDDERCVRSAANGCPRSRARSSAGSRRSTPRRWRSWSTPRAPPASPRARCTTTVRC
jgi:long-chain acyl-CoA synthetase